MRLLLLASLSLFSVACSSHETEGPARPNFIVIDIDTLTASRVGAFHGDKPVTPQLDALARKGVSFTRAFSQSGWTLPALTSLLTGRYPVRVRAQDKRIAWKQDETRTLPSILSMYGYHTAVFWGSGMGPLFSGVSEGFADVVLDEPPADKPGPGHGRGRGPAPRSPATVAGGEILQGVDSASWIRERAEEPFFLLLHQADLANISGGIPQEVQQTFTAPRPGVEALSVGGTYRSLVRENGEDYARSQAIAAYDGALHWHDRQVGELLRQLEDSGLRERTVVMVLSNHGQDLFEHTLGAHGVLYDSVLRIPLLISDPALPLEGLEIDVVVQTIDVAPSILERAGIPADREMDGQSWQGLLRGEPAPPTRDVYAYVNGCNAALRTERYKFVLREDNDIYLGLLASQGVSLERTSPKEWLQRLSLQDEQLPALKSDAEFMRSLGFQGGISPHGGVTGFTDCRRAAVELFDLQQDPGELRDLVLERPEISAELGLRLFRWLAARSADQQPMSELPVSDENRRLMQERGYWELVDPEASRGGAHVPRR